MFGHEAGAFTGATKSPARGGSRRPHGGTLFLDELGDAFHGRSGAAAARRGIWRGDAHRFVEGDPRGRAVSSRATNEHLPVDGRKRGKFRADLLDRLSFRGHHVAAAARARGRCRWCWPSYFGQRMAAMKSEWRMAGQGSGLLRRESSARSAPNGRAMSANCAMSWNGRSIAGPIPCKAGRLPSTSTRSTALGCRNRGMGWVRPG